MRARCQACGTVFVVPVPAASALVAAAPSPVRQTSALEPSSLAGLAGGETLESAPLPPAAKRQESSQPKGESAGSSLLHNLIGPPGKGRWIFLGALGACPLSMIHPLLFALLGLLVIAVGFVFITVGSLRGARAAAHRDYSVLRGLFVPFYGLCFLIRNWDVMRAPWFCMARGFLLMALPVVGLLILKQSKPDFLEPHQAGIAASDDRSAARKDAGQAEPPRAVRRERINAGLSFGTPMSGMPMSAPSPGAELPALVPDPASLARLGPEVRLGSYTLRPPATYRQELNGDRQGGQASWSSGASNLELRISRQGGVSEYPKIYGNGKISGATGWIVVLDGYQIEYGTINGIRFVRAVSADGKVNYITKDRGHVIDITLRYSPTDDDAQALLESSIRTLRRVE